MPHTIPQHPGPPSRSSSEVNTVAFASSSSPASYLYPTARSRAMTSVADEDQLVRRRSRGLSLNAAALLSMGSGNDVKGKAKDSSHPDSPRGSPKVLSRRPSFWSRKKSAPSTHEPAPPPPQEDQAHLAPSLPLPELPSLLPISPFEIDLTPERPASPPKMVRSHHQRGLSRSHSERGGSSRYVPKQEQSSTLLPSPHPSPTTRMRPSTADSPPIGFGFNPPTPDVSRPSTFHEQAGPNSRRRSLTNPPLLQRWSMGLFSSNSSSHGPSPMQPSTPPPLPSVSLESSPRPSISRPSHNPGPPVENESPELYLQRILMTVSKAEVTTVLASRGDDFHRDALRAYIRQFDFVDDPLDIALRKLLMDVSLPRETQQIDRVMEAFASRYTECNVNLFISDDHPYIMAFSLIMLHTDAFNKSNKRKMTKADYIKNTKLPGIAPEVLDCFFDNIVFAPFIFIEDPLDVNGQPSEGFGSRSSTQPIANAGSIPANSSSLLTKTPKLDPYYLIAHGLLGPLRVDVDTIVPSLNPYTFKGTGGRLDEELLHRAFAKATIVEVGPADPTPHLTYAFGVAGAPPSPLVHTMNAFNDLSPMLNGEVHTLRVTKVGTLSRKDDLISGGRKSTNRKWKMWGVILTGSQLLLFRDPVLVQSLMAQWVESDGQIALTQAAVLKPDEVFSVKDSIAVYDHSYVRYENTFRYVMPDNRHILFQAPGDEDLNEWITRINYASAFKSAGVRMRSLAMSGKDVELTGVAAASSHLHDLHLQEQDTTVQASHHAWGQDAPDQLMGMLAGPSRIVQPSTRTRRRMTVMSAGTMDFDVPSAPEVDGADQFKATFDQVKKELAAGHLTPPSDDDSGSERILDSSSDSLPLAPSALRTRAQIIQSKLSDLASKASVATAQLDSDLRFVRNVAILTPFQRTTRDRLTLAVQSVSQRVMQLRLELSKYACHREVLLADLNAERREWKHASRIALRSATEMLSTEAEKRSKKIRPPMMTISPSGPSFEPALRTSDTSLSQLETPSAHRPESSICESFHSALDYADWSNSDLGSSGFTPKLVESPQPSSHSGSSYFPEGQLASVPEYGVVDDTMSPMTSPAHEKFVTAPEGSIHQHHAEDSVAEEWNKTRAAQRVSLVRLPSQLDMSAVASRPGTWGRASQPPPPPST
ncbi:hypothetical protein DL96DRAFT_1519946 [Flagelloscypha sp. PMI_526]|nr:hypothetical protein DL96DRAFT_1519946 [Flagelloscypha sp. PMI_526]